MYDPGGLRRHRRADQHRPAVHPVGERGGAGSAGLVHPGLRGPGRGGGRGADDLHLPEPQRVRRVHGHRCPAGPGTGGDGGEAGPPDRPFDLPVRQRLVLRAGVQYGGLRHDPPGVPDPLAPDGQGETDGPADPDGGDAGSDGAVRLPHLLDLHDRLDRLPADPAAVYSHGGGGAVRPGPGGGAAAGNETGRSWESGVLVLRRDAGRFRPVHRCRLYPRHRRDPPGWGDPAAVRLSRTGELYPGGGGRRRPRRPHREPGPGGHHDAHQLGAVPGACVPGGVHRSGGQPGGVVPLHCGSRDPARVSAVRRGRQFRQHPFELPPPSRLHRQPAPGPMGQPECHPTVRVFRGRAEAVPAQPHHRPWHGGF